MARSVEKSGKTVQEAIDSALEELNASVEEVIIEVLEEGRKRRTGNRAEAGVGPGDS